jgi:hypothetical protein
MVEVRRLAERVRDPEGGARPLAAYAATVLATATSFGFDLALAPVAGGRSLLLLYVPAILFGAGLGGLGPALTAAALALIASLGRGGGAALLLDDPAGRVEALLFVVVAVFAGLAGQRLERNRRQAAEALRHLEVREARCATTPGPKRPLRR